MDGSGDIRNYQEARRLFALAKSQGDAYAAQCLKELEAKIHVECPLLGNQVVITRTCRSSLNGKTGVAASFDHARGRYVLILRGKPDHRQKPAT